MPSATVSAAVDPGGSPDKLRVALSSGIGTTIENYDFLAYSTAAALYFGPAFFPGSDPAAATLLSFATLGVGFVTRPIGAALGGYLGDRFGRKPVLVTALLVMGIATVAIGLLPTYRQIGVWAPILLTVVRMIQGLAFGAEWGGAMVMAFEHAPWKKRGQYSAIPQAGIGLGLGLANIVFLISTRWDNEWAWRAPFLASSLLIVAGLIMRAKMPESPEFEQARESGTLVRNPLVRVFRDDSPTILRTIALRLVETGSFYLIVTYLLSYLTTHHLAGRGVGLTGLILTALISVVAIVLWGALSDRVGRRTLYWAGSIATLLFAFPMFWLVNTGNAVVIVLVYIIGLSGVQGCLVGAESAYFAELFDRSKRTSGASLGYQLASTISGFVPFIATAASNWLGWTGVALIYAAMGLVGLIGTAATRETWGHAQRLSVDRLARATNERALTSKG